jgi:signal transduction histidine kinase
VTESQSLSPALRAVSDAVLAVASQRSVEEVLQQLVDCARQLAGARFAALGIPDGEGGFAQFLVSGMSDDLIASMGPLPRTHGLLAVMLETPESYRSTDIHTHERFNGWWPDGHPDMRSFLGVPIVAPEGVIGAFYLTEKEGAAAFGDEDQELIELLAAHAAIAITNARLYEASRELSVLSERNRLALELHDTVSQKLFSLVLTAEAAAVQLGRDTGAAAASVERIKALGREALEELRALIFELRPPDLARDGLAETLRKHVEVIRPLQDVTIRLELDGDELEPDTGRDREILRIAQEALHNALKHARPTEVTVRLQTREGRLHLEVADNGRGFDPAGPDIRSRRLGLTSMEERAERMGGALGVHSAPGAGTRITLEAPLG